VLIAIGNSGDPGLAPSAEGCLEDASPLVRGAAAWALGEINPVTARRLAADRLDREQSPDVRAEWRAIEASMDKA
jgi:epoxyqueuosine reductase